ncbi:hypothetical protein GcM1_148004 [Golovinomyces cichoracearum]|uniref:Uncharacterized protein n=1 Tax=Golovinomyces cichoracearum TaxID=62708 RepID=A0A420JB55_9PEZI|nr:hypothetical protein GcM1_148004 [Golovinomyces cichoracearum]
MVVSAEPAVKREKLEVFKRVGIELEIDSSGS